MGGTVTGGCGRSCCTAHAEEDTLTRRVALMRRLGVVKHRETILGPVPVAASPAETVKELTMRERTRKHYEELFGRGVGDRELDGLPGAESL